MKIGRGLTLCGACDCLADVTTQALEHVFIPKGLSDLTVIKLIPCHLKQNSYKEVKLLSCL